MFSICFCGVDGSGKTSQINILKDILKRINREVIVIHMFSENSTIISKLHNKNIINKFIVFIRNLNDSFLNSSLKIIMRLTNILLDSWITTAINARKYKNKIVIYDRYFYDVLVILASEYPKIVNFLMSFAVIIPKPNTVFILDINPEVAIQRKEENSLRETKVVCDLYRLLGEKINWEPVNANLSKTEVSAQIQKSLKGII